MSTHYERKIILVGKTGNGKSSLGNVLLLRRAFTEARSFSAVTKKCQLEKIEETVQLERIEENVSVVDTPGLFDSDVSTSLVKNALEIQRAVQLCPNPHAFLIVLNGKARLTEEELLTIDVLRIIFGEQCLKKAVIVLTHIENDLDQKELKQMIADCSEMSGLIEQCGGRFARIDNKDPRPEHKECIISIVDTVSKRGTEFFENEYLDVHKQILLEKKLTCLDSKLVHDQIKKLSEKIVQAVEEEKMQRLKELRLKYKEELRLKEEEKEQRLKELRLKYEEELRLKEEEKEQRLKYFKRTCACGVVSAALTGGVVSRLCVQNPQVVASLTSPEISQLDVARVVPGMLSNVISQGDATVVPTVVVQTSQEVARVVPSVVSNVISQGDATVVPSVVVQTSQEVESPVSNANTQWDVPEVVLSFFRQNPQVVARLVSIARSLLSEGSPQQL